MLPASPVTPDSRRPGNGLPLVPTMWPGAWQMVGFNKSLWNCFLVAPVFVVSNTEVKQWKCPGSKGVRV